MCPNPDPNIDLPHWKYVVCCFQYFPLLSLPFKDTSPLKFMSYTKYYAYNNIKMYCIHGLLPLC